MSQKFECITFNTQRNYSRWAIQSISNLVRRYQNAVLFLQEVTPERASSLQWQCTSSLHVGENMIIAPSSYRLREHGEFQFGSQSFLIADVENAEISLRCVTGKLPNGIVSSTRRKILESLLALHHMDTSLLALDTNFLFSSERRKFTHLLRQYGFSATTHPRWTHNLARLEPVSPLHKILRLYGRFFRKRSELDFLIHSDDIMLKNTHVISKVTTSDHEPVFGSFVVPNT